MKYLRIQLCDLPLAKIFDPCSTAKQGHCTRRDRELVREHIM